MNKKTFNEFRVKSSRLFPIIFANKSISTLKEIKLYLHQTFALKDLYDLKDYLELNPLEKDVTSRAIAALVLIATVTFGILGIVDLKNTVLEAINIYIIFSIAIILYTLYQNSQNLKHKKSRIYLKAITDVIHSIEKGELILLNKENSIFEQVNLIVVEFLQKSKKFWSFKVDYLYKDSESIRERLTIIYKSGDHHQEFTNIKDYLHSRIPAFNAFPISISITALAMSIFVPIITHFSELLESNLTTTLILLVFMLIALTLIFVFFIDLKKSVKQQQCYTLFIHIIDNILTNSNQRSD